MDREGWTKNGRKKVEERVKDGGGGRRTSGEVREGEGKVKGEGGKGHTHT